MCGKMFDIVMQIYRHWAVIAHSEKLLDIISLGNCNVHLYTKSQYSFCAKIVFSKSVTRVNELILMKLTRN